MSDQEELNAEVALHPIQVVMHKAILKSKKKKFSEFNQNLEISEAEK
jgi:hypothetical protein